MKSRGNTHPSCVFELNYHLVFVTKFRRKVINEQMKIFSKELFQGLCEKWGCELIECNGESDHIHLLVNAHPNINLSKFINNLKTVSSRRMKNKFKEHVDKFYWKPFFWSRAYCIVSTGGAPLDIVKKYIQNQGKPKG